jgi:glutamate---cysteine ligase / carboxylate-amine ligase
VRITERFGDSPPFTLGVEEELMLLDAETLEPAAVADAVIAEAAAAGVPGATLKEELFAAVLEVNSPVCRTPGEVLDLLASARDRTARLAERHGAVLAAFGAHPFSPSAEQAFSQDDRYRPMIEFGGPVTTRQNVCGFHVHVGMPSGEACHRALEGALPWLPVVLALSANSPFVDGVATGLLSNRAEMLGLLYRNGAPPAFGSYAGWYAHAERLIAIGVIDGYTRLWWDIRPHPHYGTIEIRMPDQPTSVRLAAALAALLQALCATAAEAAPASVDPGRRGDYVENRWRALRFGPRAELIHADGDRVASVADLLDELRDRVAPAARELGGDALIAALTADGCEADVQLAAGDARAAAASVVERSVESPA